MSGDNCRCLCPPFHYTDYDSCHVGVDETEGRYADVSVERCNRCGQRWLRYHYEVEAYPRSGRWYQVAISEAEAVAVTATTAVAMMCRHRWHFRGGSYFNSAGDRCEWPIDPNHL